MPSSAARLSIALSLACAVCLSCPGQETATPNNPSPQTTAVQTTTTTTRQGTSQTAPQDQTGPVPSAAPGQQGRRGSQAPNTRRDLEPGTQAREASEPENNTPNLIPVPPEAKNATEHVWTAGGHNLRYTATAGNLLIKDENDKVNGSIFYVAYTAPANAGHPRPVTFLYNGGPGSATVWLHMGSVGPVRVMTKSPQATGAPPFHWVQNEYSLIDQTDLVFVDAPQTGFSRAVGKGTPKDFAGVDQDVRAFEKFIVRYITLNSRWNSPKYLFGESYGTPRSAALVAALNNDGIAFNGVVLLSSILNYYVRSPGYDLDSTTYLPSFAAIAWYHNKVPHTGTMESFVQGAREFARGPYANALQQGDMLPQAQFDEAAAKVSSFTGLSVEYVKRSKLRLSPTRFRKELMRPEGKILGRYDARFEGDDTDDIADTPGFDPSDSGISGVYVGAFHDYIQSELKYMSTDPYNLQGPGINQNWDWHHTASGSRGRQDQPDTAIDLSDAMRKNTQLRVFSANGWYDLATPFFGTEHDLGEMMLPRALQGNVSFGYYPAGHMVYLNVDALKAMHADLSKWYAAGGY